MAGDVQYGGSCRVLAYKERIGSLIKITNKSKVLIIF